LSVEFSTHTVGPAVEQFIEQICANWIDEQDWLADRSQRFDLISILSTCRADLPILVQLQGMVAVSASKSDARRV
jgi:hypothetical protein